MLSLLFVLLIPSPSSIFFGCILDVPGSGLRTLEAGVGTLVSVSVALVDARTIRWSGSTTPGSLSVCHYPGSVPNPTSLQKSFQEAMVVHQGRDYFSLTEASSDKSWVIVSVRVATVALFAAVDIARLARASTVSAW